MGMFKMEKPRRFNHQYIYVDERKEKLQNCLLYTSPSPRDA